MLSVNVETKPKTPEIFWKEFRLKSEKLGKTNLFYHLDWHEPISTEQISVYLKPYVEVVSPKGPTDVRFS